MLSVTLCVYLHAHIFSTISNNFCLSWCGTLCINGFEVSLTSAKEDKLSCTTFACGISACILFANYPHSSNRPNQLWNNAVLWVFQFKFIVICCSRRQSFSYCKLGSLLIVLYLHILCPICPAQLTVHCYHPQKQNLFNITFNILSVNQPMMIKWWRVEL